MTTISLMEASLHLEDLVRELPPGEVLVIMENDQPVAQLTSTRKISATPKRELGTMTGTVISMAEDFDAPLEDFEDTLQ